MRAEEMQKRTDDILAQMDEKGISDKKFRYRDKRLVKAEFATIAVAHNIRKMISNGYVMSL